MFYLNKYLSGKAKACVERFLSLCTPTAYHDALVLLKNRFGSDFVVANASRQSLCALCSRVRKYYFPFRLVLYSNISVPILSHGRVGSSGWRGGSFAGAEWFWEHCWHCMTIFLMSLVRPGQYTDSLARSTIFTSP